MNNSKKQITVYCSSSNEIPEIYFMQTEIAIRLIVENGYEIIYGGGERGLMGTVAETALKHGGKITGVIPRFMIEREWEHKGITNMIHVETLHERKAKLIENSCAVLALPGGTGTLDELFDVISLKKLGLYPHPIIILNINGYYSYLNMLTDRMISERFLKVSDDDIWKFVSSPEEIVKLI
jgi:uncharacterized protein (TIGR00730 family)